MGQDTEIVDEPPVKLMIRTGGGSDKTYQFRFENEWPLARMQWTKFYLKVNRPRRTAAASPSSHAGVSSSAPSNAGGERQSCLTPPVIPPK